MILYPAGTECPNHHHEGAEHFMYVLAGGGTAWANEHAVSREEGRSIWYANRERHYLKSDPLEGMRFVEYFVPGECTTVWALARRSAYGGRPARNIRGRPPCATSPGTARVTLRSRRTFRRRG